MLLAFPPSDSGSMQQNIPSQQSKEYLNKAIFYHSKHLDIGPDPGGHFVAHTNLGLCVGRKCNTITLSLYIHFHVMIVFCVLYLEYRNAWRLLICCQESSGCSPHCHKDANPIRTEYRYFPLFYFRWCESIHNYYYRYFFLKKSGGKPRQPGSFKRGLCYGKDLL